MKIRDSWDDGEATYLEIKIGKAECVCVKKRGDLTYILSCYDGREVYSDIGGADFPLRNLVPEERAEIKAFAERSLYGNLYENVPQ